MNEFAGRHYEVLKECDSSLATPPPSPVCSRCGDPLCVGVCENCLPDTPQPEASDREIAGEIVGMGAAYVAERYHRSIGEIVEDACSMLATIRADERRKERERIGRELAELSTEKLVNGKRRMVLEIEMNDLSAILRDS